MYLSLPDGLQPFSVLSVGSFLLLLNWLSLYHFGFYFTNLFRYIWYIWALFCTTDQRIPGCGQQAAQSPAPHHLWSHPAKARVPPVCHSSVTSSKSISQCFFFVWGGVKFSYLVIHWHYFSDCLHPFYLNADWLGYEWGRLFTIELFDEHIKLRSLGTNGQISFALTVTTGSKLIFLL